jgi:hypothetical protein
VAAVVDTEVAGASCGQNDDGDDDIDVTEAGIVTAAEGEVH